MVQALHKNLLASIIGSGSVTYYIPAFQRNYSWQEKHCRTLWDDILETIKRQKDGTAEGRQFTHYFGDIVSKTTNNQGRLMLVDGQQRITTTILLILAIMRHYPDKAEELQKTYIENKSETEKEFDKRIKLKSVNKDQEYLLKIVDNDLLEKDMSESLLVSNYEFFKKKLEEWDKEKQKFDDLIERGLEKLQVVHVELGSHDDANIIFEKLNSAGEPLSVADLIRNHLLSGVADINQQTSYFEDYWKPIENNIKDNLPEKDNKKKDKIFANFFWYYLVIRNYAIKNPQKENKEKDLYENFKKYVKTYLGGNSIEQLLEDLLNFSGYYSYVLNTSKINDNGLRKNMEILLELRVEPFRTLLLHLMFYFCTNKINAETARDNVYLMYQFLLLTLIVVGKTGHLGNVLRWGVIKTIEQNFTQSNDYQDILRYYFFHNIENLAKITANNVTGLTKPIAEFDIKKSIYIQQILLFLERSMQSKKEPVSIEYISVEHILPQKPKPNSQWKKDFPTEEEHTKYCYMLGNLTLTGYNSELSNKDFKEKKEEFYKKSPLACNRAIAGYSVWTKQEIEKRTQELVLKLAEGLSFSPGDWQPAIADKQDNEYDLEEIKNNIAADSSYFTGTRPEGFSLYGNRREASNWKFVYVEILQELYKNPAIATYIKKHIQTYDNEDTGKRFYDIVYKRTGENNNDVIDAKEIADGVYAKTVLSTRDMINRLIEVFEIAKVDKDDFKIYLKEEEDDEEQ